MRFISILFLVATLTGCANTSKAEGYAREYARFNFPGATIQNIQCERSDSDGNGRVRCNISIRGSGQTQVEHVECPSDWIPQPFKTTCVGIKGSF